MEDVKNKDTILKHIWTVDEKLCSRCKRRNTFNKDLVCDKCKKYILKNELDRFERTSVSNKSY